MADPSPKKNCSFTEQERQKSPLKWIIDTNAMIAIHARERRCLIAVGTANNMREQQRMWSAARENDSAANGRKNMH
jgi:hypothetical protein